MDPCWGQRTDLHLPAEVRGLRQRGETAAQILNMSISGALIRTALDVEAFAGVEVKVNNHWLLAWVTRRGPDMIAVEWMEMAPDAIVRELELAALGLTFPARASPVASMLDR